MQRTMERTAPAEAIAQFSRRCHGMPTVPYEMERLLARDYCCSLTMVEKDARQLR